MIMNWVDLVFGVFLLAGLIMGLRSGFFGELPRFISSLIVFLLCFGLYIPFGALLIAHTRLQGEDLALALAFMLIVITVSTFLLVIRMILNLVAKIALSVKGSRIGGGLLGLCCGTMVAFICVFGIGLWPNPDMRRLFVEESYAGRLAQVVSVPIVETLGSVRITMEPAPVEENE